MPTNPSTRVFLVRHGATTSTADDRFAGSSDVELSADGITQVTKLSQRLAKAKIDAAYCSHMRRAIDTATIVAKPHGITPLPWPELREIDHGHWEGVPHREVEEKFAAEYAAWSADPVNTRIPGGESGRDVLERARAAMERIVAAHAGQTVLVVSHKATNRLLLAEWLGFDPRRYRDRLAQDLACLNIVLFRGASGPQALLVNDTSHYSAITDAMPFVTAQQLMQSAFEHHRAGRFEEARNSYRQVLMLEPRHADALHMIGILEQQQGDHQRAFELITAAIRIDPSPAEFHYNLGNSLLHLSRTAAAAVAFAAALARDPDLFEARRNLGSALMFEGRANEAADAYRAALVQRPDAADVHNNLGMALKDTGDVDAAVKSFRRAIELMPGYRGAWDNYLYALLYHPGYDAAAIRREHERWGVAMMQAAGSQLPTYANDRSADRRLRVGYVSPNFREHPVGRALLPLLENHDRTNVEVICYADVEASPNDPVAQRLRRCAAQWHVTTKLDDAQLAAVVREHGIDLLVDTTLHMTGSRLGVFAQKPAPVQLTFIGYPATTGLSAITYRITDPWLDPPGAGSDAANVETLVRLRRTFWCYDAGDSPDVTNLPARSRDSQITFGSLNNPAKISAPVMDTWAQILAKVPTSRLLLYANERVNPGEWLRREFADRGVAPDRLTILPRAPRRQYLQQYAQIDIALDPWPYNGHMTTCDALWMGVPVVSATGQTSVARGGASILSAVGLGELLASSREQYVEIAVSLANDLDRLAELRRTMRQRVQESPLADGKSFARDVESIYRDLWQRWCGSDGSGGATTAASRTA